MNQEIKFLTLEQLNGYPADFRVRYRFYPTKEGDIPAKRGQGYRSDFQYAEQWPEENGTFVIWPEFEDQAGNEIVSRVVIDLAGTARMWVINPPMRKLHRERIHVGTKGYFIEGLTRVAECEVIEVLYPPREVALI